MNKFLFVLGLLSLTAAIGCGAGSGITFPPTTGNFTAANLNGQYVYEIHGQSAVTGKPYREYGVFTADGAGHITGGTDDFTSTNTGGLQSNAITGSYQVFSDGTGFISIGPTSLASSVNASQVTFAITMIATASPTTKIDLMEDDIFASGAGVAELQDPATLTTAPVGTYVFQLHQSVSAQAAKSASQVGAIAVANGTFTGNMDQNLGGATTSPSISNGSFNAPVSGRGTGSFSDGANTTTFEYYVVNASKFVLLVSNSGAVGSGSAELQSGAVANGLSGNYAFGSRGDDLLDGVLDGVATVGQFNAASGTMTGTAQSAVDGGFSQNIAINNCFTAAGNGRVAVDNCSGAASQFFWMVNPSRAFFINVNGSATEDGTADLQTLNSFSNSSLSGQYALLMDGSDVTFLQPANRARVGILQFQSGGNLALTELANDLNSGPSSAQNLTGIYQVSGDGLVQVNLGNSSLDFVGYAVSGSKAYMLQIDPGFTTSGTAELQQ